jgi:hypothetical protein
MRLKIQGNDLSMDIIGVTQRFRNDGNNHLKPSFAPRSRPLPLLIFFIPHRPDDALLVGAVEKTSLSM